jgi:hypothetical protein
MHKQAKPERPRPAIGCWYPQRIQRFNGPANGHRFDLMWSRNLLIPALPSWRFTVGKFHVAYAGRGRERGNAIEFTYEETIGDPQPSW